MSLINIPAFERGVIRVFALSLTEAEAKTLAASPEAVAQTLGTDALEMAHVELFPLRDLEGLGLASYLAEGGAVSEAQLGPDRAKLDALEGWVLVLYSLAFSDRAMTLSPSPALTLIGTYGETRPDFTSDGPLEAEAAQLYTGTPAPRKKRSDAAVGGMVATFVLIFLGLFTWAFIWMAG